MGFKDPDEDMTKFFFFLFYSLFYVDIQRPPGNLQKQYKQHDYTLIKINRW